MIVSSVRRGFRIAVGLTLAHAASAGAQGDVTFLTCTPTAEGALTYDCRLAGSCSSSPCDPSQWTPIAGHPSLPESFFEPGGTRGSAIQVTPVAIEGAVYTLVNKDVGAERWSIIRNDSTGVVTGNVFTGGAAGDAQFIYCLDPAENAEGVAFGECFAAAACGTAGCNPADWTSIGGTATIGASFFSPSGGRGSGLQVTPDGDQILISKDLASQRWTITTLATTTSPSFPVGIGPAFGNVFAAASLEPTLENVLITNGQYAFAAYEDSVVTARRLRERFQVLVDGASAETLAAAREAWLAAREPYGQTEVYRFRRGPIDALRDDGTIGEEGDGPEGRINAWPLGEALIDYVAPAVDGDAGPESGGAVPGVEGNVIADRTNFPNLTPEVLAGLTELGGDERNVATGYHAIEFLLWGQDLNSDGSPGFSGRDATPGERPFTDYLPVDQGCTNGNCDRRGQYLLAVTDLLIGDLERVAEAWRPDAGNNYYATFVAGEKVSLANILEGMGRLGYGELAGERMNVALVANSQEDEHSCFSDNTHRDLYLNALGIQNSYLGRYTRIDGRAVSGPGVRDLLIAQGDADVAENLSATLADTVAKLLVIDQRAKDGTPFDNQIQEGITEPNIVAAIEALKLQTDVIEDAIEALGVTTGDLRQDTEEFD
jgi:putative iron-regulated protein